MKKFKNLNNFSTSQVKALFGFHPTILAEILFMVLPVLEQRRKTNLATRATRKREPREGEGRPREVLPLHKVLMTLIYLRHNVSHEVVGAMVGFSADSSENALAEVLPVLRDLFPKEKWEAEGRYGRREWKWSPEAVDRVIVDSFETPVCRQAGLCVAPVSTNDKSESILARRSVTHSRRRLSQTRPERS